MSNRALALETLAGSQKAGYVGVECPSLPVPSGRFVSSGFGCRPRVGRTPRPLPEDPRCPPGFRWHNGWDIPMPEGTPVASIESGIVEHASDNDPEQSFTPGFSGYGRVVVVRHPNGLRSLYTHLSYVNVEEGKQVRKGEIIGSVGKTQGTRQVPNAVFRASGPHLHFEISTASYPQSYQAETRINPSRYYAGWGITLSDGNTGRFIIPAECEEPARGRPVVEVLEQTVRRVRERLQRGAREIERREVGKALAPPILLGLGILGILVAAGRGKKRG